MILFLDVKVNDFRVDALLISSLLFRSTMEAEEAGVAWPQLPMRPTQSQNHHLSESGSEDDPNSSQMQSSSRDNESRKIFNAEKRKRKAERAILRAESRARKEARRSARESLLVNSKDDVMVPSSSAPSRPTLSFPEVSTSPVDDDEKEEDRGTQSVETEESQPSAPMVESEQQTESQDSTSTQQSPSPHRLPVTHLLGSKHPRKDRREPEGDERLSDNESQDRPPSTLNTSGSSELDSSIPEQADLETAIKSIAPKRPNAEAGPSVKKPKTKPATSTPVTPRTTKKRTRESGVSHRASPKVEDDDSLRRRLSNPSAVAEFIASKYWAPPYLNRLEAAGSESIQCDGFTPTLIDSYYAQEGQAVQPRA